MNVLSNPVYFDGQQRLTGELAGECHSRLQEHLPWSAPVALVTATMPEAIAAAAWLASTGTDGMILPSERFTPEVARFLSERGLRGVAVESGRELFGAAPSSVRPGRVRLLTSGTTGVFKLLDHTWDSLFTLKRLEEARPLKWLVTYQAGTYAWYQMITLGLFVPEQALVVASERTPLDLIRAAVDHEVTAVSATPSFWRVAMLQVSADTLRALPLIQITLGGERVDQRVLDQLQNLYPAARISHIYASTEAGATIVVHDGREGFPREWLERHKQSGVQLRVTDGILQVQSPHAATGQPAWIDTGDRVEIRDDRVVILGRADRSIINVGGLKVASRDVENCLLADPAVAWCRVYGRRAPLVGEMVAADVVLKAGVTRTEVELSQFCRHELAEHMVPRLWNFLPEIPMTANLKTRLATNDAEY